MPSALSICDWIFRLSSTAASYALHNPLEVVTFLDHCAQLAETDKSSHEPLIGGGIGRAEHEAAAPLSPSETAP